MDTFQQNQKQLIDELIAHIKGHNTIEIGDSEHSVIACPACNKVLDYDEQKCPECGSNLVDAGDALVCVGCGYTACGGASWKGGL